MTLKKPKSKAATEKDRPGYREKEGCRVRRVPLCVVGGRGVGVMGKERNNAVEDASKSHPALGPSDGAVGC